MTLWPGCMTICWNLTHTKLKSLSNTSQHNTKLVENIKSSSCVKKPWCFPGLETQHGETSYIHQSRQINHIRKYKTTDATKSLVKSRVTSWLDYCNALQVGVPKTVLKKFQNVQDTAARLVVQLIGRFGHGDNFMTGRCPSHRKIQQRVRLRGMASVKCQSINGLSQ